VIGVGEYYSFASNGTLIEGNVPDGLDTTNNIPADTYTLHISVENPRSPDATEPILNSGLFSQTQGAGAAGNVTITTGELIVRDQAQVSAATSASGQGGNLSVRARDSVTVSDQGSLSAEATATATGNAGSVDISTRQLTVEQGSQVLASTVSETSTSDGITLRNLETLQVSGGSQISASTERGTAGGLRINVGEAAVESVLLSGQGSRLSAQATESGGNAGSVTLNARQLTVSENAEVSASNISGRSENITLQGLDTLQVTSGGEISASTQTGIAGSLSINLGEQAAESVLVRDNGRLSVEATGNNRESSSGLVTINTRELAVEDGSTVSASTNAGQGQGIQLQNLETLTLNNSLISSSTQSGVAGSVLIDASESVTVNNGLISSSASSNTGVAGSVTLNALESVMLNGIFNTTSTGEPQGGVLAEATGGGTAGSVSINTEELTIQNRAAAAVSSRAGSGNAGDINITAEEVTLNSGGRIEAQTDAGGSDRPANITLQGLENLDINNGLISSSTESGVAGRVSIDASESVTVNNGLISSSSNSGRAGSVLIDGSESITVNNGLISSSTTSGFAGSVTIGALDSVTLNGIFNTTATGEAQGGVLATATAGGTAGSLTINTQELTIENGAAVAVSSREGSGNAGDITITSEEVTLNNGGRITAETDAGGRNRPSNITLQGLETLELDEGTISASTSTGVAGNVSINAFDSVELDEGSRIAVIATGVNGTAGNLSVNTGEFLVRDGSEVSVSSRQGEAGNLNVTANSLSLNQGSLTAEAGQGEGGANINLNVSGFLRLDNESLISALATGNATGGNININAQYVIASFPTGSEGSDIVADAVLGNGGQITINALGIFGLEFRPAQTPLNDITASSQGGAAGTVQITTLGIDPSRGLAALPLNFIDVSGLVGGQCSASGADGELSQFTIIGRGGLPLNPTDPLAPEAEASDWVTFDPESDRISPQAHTPIRITPFTSSVTPQQLAQFPSLCYQSWSTSAIAP